MKIITDHKYDTFEVLELVAHPSVTEILEDHYQNDGFVSYSHVCNECEVSNIKQMWDALPEGDTYFCYRPKYAIRISNEGKAIFAAAICWEGNYIGCEGIAVLEKVIPFEANSDEGQALYALCKKLCEHERPIVIPLPS